MALESKSILEQQLRKKDSSESGNWPWRLLLFTVIIFGFTIFIYAGMEFGYKIYLKNEISNIDSEVQDLDAVLNTEVSQSLISLYSQLTNIKTLLAAHISPSKFFSFLKNNTDERVYFSNLSLTISDKSVKLDGVAADYPALIRQLEYFRRSPSVKSVSLDDSGINDRLKNDIKFTARLIVNNDVLK